MPRTAASTSKSDQVYATLRTRIIDGYYSPGYRLVLSTLAAEFGVSTVPVREAIRWLEAEGLVEYTHNVGAQVSRVDATSYAESMSVLAVLEGAVTALSAPHLTEADLEEAEAYNREMALMTQAPSFDSNVYRRLNGHFHSTLSLRCPNERMHSLMTTEAERVNRIRRTSFRFTSSRSRLSVEQHDHLIHLIRIGADPGEIELYARNHKMASMREALLADDV
ncbi:GntR family transcriptional regulator [Flaviflexus huanghaiensis]|uniref:GntR family transcriptional regulator n=1 Tax=Flaviflexus huanghaiensis TaxID=1111473 RepID=UPI0015F99FB7|nr:GntR family transcriptional regulator [Flaviflexus huanghaiensis]